MQLTNASAAVVKTYTYEAFGSLVAQTGTVANPYQFQTKHINSTTGLVNFGFRSYNPSLGRFITADPLGFVNGPNLYAYVGNNPLNWVDPWGLCNQKPEFSQIPIPKLPNPIPQPRIPIPQTKEPTIEKSRSNLPARLMGYYITGIVGVGAAYVGGPIIGAITAASVGLVWTYAVSSNISPANIMGTYISSLTGFSSGWLFGPFIGKISSITISEIWNKFILESK